MGNNEQRAPGDTGTEPLKRTSGEHRKIKRARRCETHGTAVMRDYLSGLLALRVYALFRIVTIERSFFYGEKIVISAADAVETHEC